MPSFFVLKMFFIDRTNPMISLLLVLLSLGSLLFGVVDVFQISSKVVSLGSQSLISCLVLMITKVDYKKSIKLLR